MLKGHSCYCSKLQVSGDLFFDNVRILLQLIKTAVALLQSEGTVFVLSSEVQCSLNTQHCYSGYRDIPMGAQEQQ